MTTEAIVRGRAQRFLTAAAIDVVFRPLTSWILLLTKFIGLNFNFALVLQYKQLLVTRWALVDFGNIVSFIFGAFLPSVEKRV